MYIQGHTYKDNTGKSQYFIITICGTEPIKLCIALPYNWNLYKYSNYTSIKKTKLNRLLAFTLPDFTTHQTATAIKTVRH